jgi:hypothetical protein
MDEPPLPEAQPADQREPLGVPELGAEPELVLDDASPERDRPDDRGISRPPERIGQAHRV